MKINKPYRMITSWWIRRNGIFSAIMGEATNGEVVQGITLVLILFVVSGLANKEWF